MIFSIFLAFCYFIKVNGFQVSLEHNGPVILGGTINFWAEVKDGLFPHYRYEWHDSAKEKLKHSDRFLGNRTCEWNITYSRDDYSPGKYEVDLDVCVKQLIYWPCSSQKVIYNITDELNGKFQILQNNTVKDKPYVSNSTEVEHRISIKNTDLVVLQDNNFTAVAFWFMNCLYLGMTPDLTFRFNYTTADEDVTMKAVVVAARLNETSNLTDAFPENPWLDGTMRMDNSSSFDSVSFFTPWPDDSCNFSFIPKDPDKLYGYFHHEVKPRRPVVISKVAGNNWLKNGDLLNLTVTFTGSLPYYHCIQFITGEYNSTGNETCLHTQKTTTGKINIIHFFGKGDKHTVLFIIQNSVSKTVTAIVVTNYIEKKHPQLSVIIVPISCSAIAVILIVFGVAYYIQSKNRYTIEVADFDFTASNDTEYKSFKERLREAVSSAFTRVSEEEAEEGSTYWSPSRKYGSMQ